MNYIKQHNPHIALSDCIDTAPGSENIWDNNIVNFHLKQGSPMVCISPFLLSENGSILVSTPINNKMAGDWIQSPVFIIPIVV